MTSRFLTAFFLMSAALVAETPKPEPFEDALREAVKQYRAGKIEETRAAMEKAKGILDQQQATLIKSTLPDAPEGWKAESIKTEELPALLGGGRVMKRSYLQKDGAREMLLEVSYDSPTVKLIISLVANDAVAEAQGFKVKRVGGDRALIKQVGESIEVNLPLDERILVKITGSHGATEEDAMKLIRDLSRAVLKDAK
jgi:hypothetical protein